MTSKPMGIRTAVLTCYEMGEFVFKMRQGPLKQLYTAFAAIAYTCTMKRGPKGRTKIVNVDEIVELWVPVVVQLAKAHDRDEFDQAEAQIDKLLTPMLTAPVKQVREFYQKFLVRLKTEKDVPMLVWMGFEAWGKVMIQDAPDEGIKRLKIKLASEIADMVEADVTPQIADAITNALKWRSPEQLEAVKEQLKSGEKPELKGRESCLFLEVGKGKNKAVVML